MGQPGDGGRKAWPPFRRLVGAQAAHAGGDALVAIALADTLFFSVPVGQARDRVGLYLLLTMAPFALLSPVVGPLLDRWRGSYRMAVVLAAAGRGALAFGMATRTRQLVLYPMAFGLLVLSRTHGVSRGALVPQLLPRRWTLLGANARLGVVSVAAGAAVAGPGLGLQRWLGSGATLRLAGAVYVLGALAAVGIPQPPAQPRRAFVPGAHRLLAPRLLAGGVATAASRAALGFLVFFLGFVLRERGTGARGFGLVLAAAALGTFAGSVGASLLRLAVREPLLLVGSLAVTGGAAVAAADRFGIGTAAGLAAVAGFATALARLAFDSLLQREAPEEVRGRTFARYETTFQLCWVAGAGLATAVPFGPRPGLYAVAAICAAGILLALGGALRAPHTVDAGAPGGRA